MYIFNYLFVYLFIYLFMYLSIYLFIYLFIIYTHSIHNCMSPKESFNIGNHGVQERLGNEFLGRAVPGRPVTPLVLLTTTTLSADQVLVQSLTGAKLRPQRTQGIICNYGSTWLTYKPRTQRGVTSRFHRQVPRKDRPANIWDADP